MSLDKKEMQNANHFLQSNDDLNNLSFVEGITSTPTTKQSKNEPCNHARRTSAIRFAMEKDHLPSTKSGTRKSITTRARSSTIPPAVPSSSLKRRSSTSGVSLMLSGFSNYYQSIYSTFDQGSAIVPQNQGFLANEGTAPLRVSSDNTQQRSSLTFTQAALQMNQRPGLPKALSTTHLPFPKTSDEQEIVEPSTSSMNPLSFQHGNVHSAQSMTSFGPIAAQQNYSIPAYQEQVGMSEAYISDYLRHYQHDPMISKTPNSNETSPESQIFMANNGEEDNGSCNDPCKAKARSTEDILRDVDCILRLGCNDTIATQSDHPISF